MKCMEDKLSRLITIIALLTVLIYSISLDIESIDTDDYPEDYGCVHDNHAQYDDGDGVNLEFLNANYNKIH